MRHETFVTLPYDRPHDLPARFGDEGDVRTPPAYVEHFLERFTDPDDVVLDPFAGFGTTLVVAESVGREAYGVEYEADRARFVRDRVDHPERVHHGSAFDLLATTDDGGEAQVDLPAVDCVLTSPPYATDAGTHDPFANYADGTERPYDDYLDSLGGLFAALESHLAPAAYVLVDVANLKHDAGVTSLAWDVGCAVRDATTFDFVGEVVVGWEDREENDRNGRYGYGYDHSYCLVFAHHPTRME